VPEERFKKRFSPVVDAGVDRNSVKPGIQGGTGLEFVEVLVGFDEDVLCSVLCIMAVTQDLATKIIDTVLVATENLFKNRVVTLLEAPDNVDIVLVVGIHTVGVSAKTVFHCPVFKRKLLPESSLGQENKYIIMLFILKSRYLIRQPPQNQDRNYRLTMSVPASYKGKKCGVFKKGPRTEV
jgi:hypothetical protein